MQSCRALLQYGVVSAVKIKFRPNNEVSWLPEYWIYWMSRFSITYIYLNIYIYISLVQFLVFLWQGDTPNGKVWVNKLKWWESSWGMRHFHTWMTHCKVHILIPLRIFRMTLKKSLNLIIIHTRLWWRAPAENKHCSTAEAYSGQLRAVN